MVKNTFKRQKLSQQPVNAPAVPATVYETPKESLINFPSSIMNGITKEGGLVSLTFKSITCANFVERLDWMRGALIRKDGEFEPTRINEDVFNGDKMITELKQDIQALNERSQKENRTDDIKDLQSKLTNSLNDEESFRNFGINLVKQYEIENPSKSIDFNNDSYYTITKAAIPGVKISKFEDVENPDLTPYERKPTVEPPKEPISEAVATPVQEQVPTEVPVVLDNNSNSTPEVTEQQSFQNPSFQQKPNDQVSVTPSAQDNVNSSYANQPFQNSPSQGNYY